MKVGLLCEANLQKSAVQVVQPIIIQGTLRIQYLPYCPVEVDREFRVLLVLPTY
jgi:hypothetical protein